MSDNVKLRSAFIALGITATITIFGTYLVGNGIAWFGQLQKPSFLISIQLFYIVAAIYNLIFAYILYRLLILFFRSRNHLLLHAIYAVVILMVANELWNYFFMGLESTKNGFIGMLIFAPIVGLALWKVRSLDKISSILLSVYGLWVIYNIIWTYFLWQMN